MTRSSERHVCVVTWTMHLFKGVPPSTATDTSPAKAQPPEFWLADLQMEYPLQTFLQADPKPPAVAAWRLVDTEGTVGDAQLYREHEVPR